MDFDEEELAGFGGGGMQQQSHVGIDKNSGQIEGWDSIWAILKLEDEERNAMEGVGAAAIGARAGNGPKVP